MTKLLLSTLIAIFFISCSEPASKTPVKKIREVTLNATIQKSDTQLVISNDDTFDWTNVKIVINGDYKYTLESIPMLSQQKIGFMKFADNDNKLLNPFEFKIVDVQVYCKTPSGNDGFVSAAFK